MLVRMSWAPGWRVSGATGVERASPNFFVVVPTDKTVRITMSRTASEHAGNALSAFGLVALGALGIADRRRRRNESLVTVTSDTPPENIAAERRPEAMDDAPAAEEVAVTAEEPASAEALAEPTDQRD
jgi:hypothetical protein